MKLHGPRLTRGCEPGNIGQETDPINSHGRYGAGITCGDIIVCVVVSFKNLPKTGASVFSSRLLKMIPIPERFRSFNAPQAVLQQWCDESVSLKGLSVLSSWGGNSRPFNKLVVTLSTDHPSLLLSHVTLKLKTESKGTLIACDWSVWAEWISPFLE